MLFCTFKSVWSQLTEHILFIEADMCLCILEFMNMFLVFKS